MSSAPALRLVPLAVLLTLSGCKREQDRGSPAPPPAASRAAPAARVYKVGLVTDIGGRGDQSFNDGALRGLELWAAGKRYTTSGYVSASSQEIEETLTPELKARGIIPFEDVEPALLQSKSQEDYEPNLQLLVEQGVALSVAVGFMLEDAVEAVAKRNPDARFLLIDIPILDEKGAPYTLPNVRSVLYREEQGSFLVGALAGLVTKTNKVAFVGGMEIPTVKRAEAGYRAGVATTRPEAQVLVSYTGSFDNVAAGKQVGQDLVRTGADVLFQGAGADGLGVIQAVKEAHAAGKPVFAIGVDSDQSHLAPDAVLTSMLKRVDLAVYEAVRDVRSGKYTGGTQVLGLAEGGVTYAAIRVDLPNKDEIIQKLEALRQRVIAGELKVPTHPSELASFKATP